MLAEQQPVDRVEVDIERIAARGGHLVAHAVAVIVHPAVSVVLRRGVELGDRARPRLRFIRAGADDHRLTDIKFAQVQLVDLAFDAVGAALDQGDVRKGLARHLVVAAVFVDRLDLAVDGRGDGAAAGVLLELLQLALLDGDVILRLLLAGLQRLDVDGIGELLGFGRVLLLLFELLDLLVIVLDGVFHLLDLQLRLVDGELDLVGVIDEQDIARRDALPDLDLQLRDLAVFVAVDPDLVLRHNNTRAEIVRAHRAVAHDLRNALHIHRRKLLRAAGKTANQQHQRQCAGDQTFFHTITSVVFHVVLP